MLKRYGSTLLLGVLLTGWTAQANPMEISCTIRSNGANLACQVLGKERKVMDASDITAFIDAADIAAYITLKSRKGYERTYQVDMKSPQFRRLNDIKNKAPISEVANAKSNLFSEIEKKVIKLSDEMDAQAAAAELVLYDPGIVYEKIKREARLKDTELENYRKNRDQVCTSTPAFEQVSKASSRLQQTLSSVIGAFQTPGTCMASYKVYKDSDGAVDLRQLDTVADHYKANCKK